MSAAEFEKLREERVKDLQYQLTHALAENDRLRTLMDFDEPHQKLKAEVDRLREINTRRLEFQNEAHAAQEAERDRLRAENAELAATLRATREAFLELVSADEEMVEGFVSIGDTVPPELLPNLRAMKKALTEALAAPATTEPTA